MQSISFVSEKTVLVTVLSEVLHSDVTHLNVSLSFTGCSPPRTCCLSRKTNVRTRSTWGFLGLPGVPRGKDGGREGEKEINFI